MVTVREHMRLCAVGLTLLGAVAAGGGCSSPPGGSGPRSAATDLGYAEVREYEGRDLSSISDFRENSITGPQKVDESSYRLRVKGHVERPLSLTYGEVLDRPSFRKVVRLDCVEGWGVDILWEGVLVRELLEQTGVRPGAQEVVFRAVDGYSTSFPVGYVTDNDILLAYKMNGVVLPEERGFPFQLVAEDKWGYKWIKWVEEIEVRDTSGYRGYWESRGYSNTGERDQPSFGD